MLTSDQRVVLMGHCLVAGATIAQHGTHRRKLAERADDAHVQALRFYEKLAGEPWRPAAEMVSSVGIEPTAPAV